MQIEPAVGRLVARAQEAGLLRPDVEPVDVGLITHVLSGFISEGRPEVWRRYLELFMGSLRLHDGDFVPLSVAAPTEREFAQLSTNI